MNPGSGAPRKPKGPAPDGSQERTDMAKINDVQWSSLEEAVQAEEKRPSVLVVDDDHAFCETIARCLAQRGYDVTCADSGEVAAVAINETAPDVIVTDVR